MNRLITGLRAALAATGVTNFAVGAWAELDPHVWYSTFPGLGHHWVSAVGPYDEHLVRDVGASLMAIGVLLTWAALAPRARLLTPALVSTLVFAVPHLAYHVASAEHLSTGDNVVNLALLASMVVLPVWLLWAVRTGDQGPRTRDQGSLGGMRLGEPSAGAAYRVARRWSRRRFGTVPLPLVPLGHHPRLLCGSGAMELAHVGSHEVGERLKDLAMTKVALMVGCEWCIDYGSALLQRHGVDEETIRELPRWRESTAFAPLERLVIEYAEELTRTPAEASDELFARLREHFDDAQLVELTTAITYEGHRSRFYRAFNVGSQGFAACELPQAEVVQPGT
jgi:AhpD family alkylhydroperoxidase